MPESRNERVAPELDGHEILGAVDDEPFGRIPVDEQDAPAIRRGVLELRLDRLQPLVILIAKGAIGGALSLIATPPELRDVDFALRVGLQNQEGIQLGRLHDGVDVGEELAVWVAQALDAILPLATGELPDAGVLRSGLGRGRRRSWCRRGGGDRVIRGWRIVRLRNGVGCSKDGQKDGERNPLHSGAS